MRGLQGLGMIQLRHCQWIWFLYDERGKGYYKPPNRGPWSHDWNSAQSLAVDWKFNSFLMQATMEDDVSDIAEE